MKIPGFWQALAMGVLVLSSTFIALRVAFPTGSRPVRRASAVFAGAAGFLVSVYLLENPALLEHYVLEIVIGLLSVVMVFIAVLRRVFH